MFLLDNLYFQVITMIVLILVTGCIATYKPGEMEEQYKDIAISTRIHEAILDVPALRAYEINVNTIQGNVELSGFVSSRDDMDKAMAIARRNISATKLVRNRLVIHPAGGDY